MYNANTALNVEAWDLDSIFPTLPLIITRADAEDRLLCINFHAHCYEDIPRASILHDLLSATGISFEFNISFEKYTPKDGADFAG